MPNDKIVQLPSGERVQFPASMADADINGAIQQYLGAGQSKAMPTPPPSAGERFTTSYTRGWGVDPEKLLEQPTALGRIGEFGKEAAGSLWGSIKSEWQQPTVGGPEGKASALPGSQATAARILFPFHLIARGIEGLAGNAESAVSQGQKGDIAGALGSLLSTKNQMTVAENVGGNEKQPMLRGAMREVMGEGASKSRLLADQHAHALATQQHLSGVAEAVHTDAQTAMSQVLAKVDEAHPEGAFSKADIQGKVSGAVGDLVKVPEKMPASVSKILKTEQQSGWEAAAQSNTARYASQLREQGLNEAQVKQVLAKEGLSAADIEKGLSTGDKFSAEQLKQMRSDVGQELGRYGKKGVVGAALNKVYGVLSQELRGAAANSGVEREWLEANDKYNQYASDFIRGPLKRVLGGSTASGIMEPLTGTSRQALMDTLQKYKQAGFDIDMDTLQEEMRRYGMSRTVNRLSQPTKMDLLMAGFSPKALAIRQLGPRLMRNPKALDRFAGEGFDTPMSPRQVYPSKAAAMKAAKGATSEDFTEQARRGAPGIDPNLKSARRKFGKREE